MKIETYLRDFAHSIDIAECEDDAIHAAKLRQAADRIEQLAEDAEVMKFLEETNWSKPGMEDVLYCLIQLKHYAGENYPTIRAAIRAAMKQTEAKR